MRRVISLSLLLVMSFVCGADAARKQDAAIGPAPALPGAVESLPMPALNSVLKTPAASTGPVIGQQMVTASPMPVICCDKRCIDYRSHRLGSKCKFSKCDTHACTILYKDECDCCYVEVPVCIPDCCSVICSTNTRCGAFGRTITEYCWDCGFRMEIVANRQGDLTVHYFGMVR